MRVSHVGIEDECIKVYDPSKKQLLKILDSYKEAQRYTGIPHKILRNAALYKTRRYSPTLKIEVAIRISLKKQNENSTVS